MSSQLLLEKLQLKDERNLLLQGLPLAIEKQFLKVSFSKNVTPLLKSKKIDFALVFAISKNQLQEILKEVYHSKNLKNILLLIHPALPTTGTKKQKHHFNTADQNNCLPLLMMSALSQPK